MVWGLVMRRIVQRIGAAFSCVFLGLAGCAAVTEDSVQIDPNSPTEAFIVTAMGDVSFGIHGTFRSVSDKGAWAHYTHALRPLVNGDINVANLESVVTPYPLQDPTSKEFNFQMHTTGLEHLVKDLRLNVLSLANNHVGDYGREGQEATAQALSAYDALVLHHGLGTISKLSSAAVGRVGTQDIAFAALGISANAPRPDIDLPGQWNIHVKPDWEKTLNALVESRASMRILSLHEGIERQQTLEPNVQNRYRRAQYAADVDLIVAHHPHVVRGLEIDPRGRIIAFGLGNAMLHGAADISQREAAADFGLLLRLYYRRGAQGPVLEALEAIPMTSVHRAPRAMTPTVSRQRIELLNQLSRETSKDRALILRPHDETGFGVWCNAMLQTRQAKALCSQAGG